jgi:hypothetical protein
LLEKLIHWTVFLVHVHELEQWKPPLFFFFQKEKGCAFRSDDALSFVLHGLLKGKGFALSTSRKEGHGWKPRHMADLDSYYTVDDFFCHLAISALAGLSSCD